MYVSGYKQKYEQTHFSLKVTHAHLQVRHLVVVRNIVHNTAIVRNIVHIIAIVRNIAVVHDIVRKIVT
jgi:hypothetical protein